MISVIRFDGMIPLPGSDEHVSGFFASDGWALSEADGKLVVEGHGKRYVFVGYAYGVVEVPDPVPVEVEPEPGAEPVVDGPEPEAVEPEPEPIKPEPRTGKRRRA